MKYANLNLIYVNNIEKSTEYYSKLFKLSPEFISPRYVAYRTSELSQPLFALWTGGKPAVKDACRFSEIGIMLESNEDVKIFFEECKIDDSIEIKDPLYEEVFGLTFTIKDPDGHLIRISPLD
tara:strand:+ start:857 stop:1225 length:369 start_codon:yes stop_codon:yes gene_type:complete